MLLCPSCPLAVLADPMCGSGTFLIEAALMATGTAPGSFRRWWPFMQASGGLSGPAPGWHFAQGSSSAATRTLWALSSLACFPAPFPALRTVA